MKVHTVRLGIVGSEGAKFTPATEALARAAIRGLITKYNAKRVISGGCHLGGIDIWAVDEALNLHLPTEEYVPEVQQWDPPGKYGYKKRNEDIVANSDVVVCITLDKYPGHFEGAHFDKCYHHKGEGNLFAAVDHVKSGGCWTMELARKKGKHGELVVIPSPPETHLAQRTGLGICTSKVQSSPEAPAEAGCPDCYKGKVLTDVALGIPVEADKRTYGALWFPCPRCQGPEVLKRFAIVARVAKAVGHPEIVSELTR